jgi:hypothetical protein
MFLPSDIFFLLCEVELGVPGFHPNKHRSNVAYATSDEYNRDTLVVLGRDPKPAVGVAAFLEADDPPNKEEAVGKRLGDPSSGGMGYSSDDVNNDESVSSSMISIVRILHPYSSTSSSSSSSSCITIYIITIYWAMMMMW